MVVSILKKILQIGSSSKVGLKTKKKIKSTTHFFVGPHHIHSRSPGAHAVKTIRCLNDFWSEGCEDLRSPGMVHLEGRKSSQSKNSIFCADFLLDDLIKLTSYPSSQDKGCTSLETTCSSSHHLSISCISRNEPG